MSSVDNIFFLHGIINHLLNKGEKLFCAFVDFTKAFVYLVRDIIWFKLIKLGVRGKILDIIRSMYQNVKSKVKYDNSISSSFECSLGVRQGEYLSPFLFAVYLNDLEDEFSLKGNDGIDIGMLKIFMLLFADDIIIFARSAEELQNNLGHLHKYITRYRLIVNTSKTKVMVFRRGGILPRNTKLYDNNFELAIVNTFSYLGIVCSTSGSFSKCQKTLSGQATKAIFQLNSYLYHLTNITPKHKLELFDKLLHPFLFKAIKFGVSLRQNK